jgi:hypothetical protein
MMFKEVTEKRVKSFIFVNQNDEKELPITFATTTTASKDQY